MKKLSLILFLSFICGSTILFAQRESKKFAIKSGHIEIDLTGSTEGTKSIWFDEYGLKYREEIISTTTTKVFGFKNTEEDHNISLMMGKDYTSIDMLKNTGSTGELHFYEDIEENYYNMTESEKKEFEEDILQSFGGEHLGNEEVLGKKCDVVSVFGSKLWIYKGIVLKSEISTLGQKSFEEANLYEENITVPASLFNIPEGIEMTEFKGLHNLFDEVDKEIDEEKKEQEKEENTNKDLDDEDIELAPLTYSFEDFSKAMEKVTIDEYPKVNTLNLEEEYICSFMQSIYKVISIVATSNKDKTGESIYSDETNKFEKFTHKGLNMFYGDNIDDEEEFDGTMLGIDYPKHDMFIIIGTNQEMTKEALLKIADQLHF